MMSALVRVPNSPATWRLANRTNRVGIPAVLGLIVLAAGCAASRPPLAERLHPCGRTEGPSGAWCGSYQVFENRETRAGRRIDLSIVVLPAETDEYHRDPLFFLAGGPGQGAARMAAGIAGAFARVRRSRDIVLVDQRGTGHSHPLDCPSGTDSLAAAFASEDDELARLRSCLDHLDADVRQYTTNPAMDDLDDVRAFLGYEQVNLYGGSYGTRAALVYLRRHEAHVRSVILDGVAPTGMRLPLFAARDAERALRKLIADCDADSACHAAYPDLGSRIIALLARLQRSPARVRLVHPRTGAVEDVEVPARAVASAIFGALYSPATASVLPILLDHAEKNDFQGLLALAFAGDTSENMSVGMQLSVLCSEDAPHIAAGDVQRETAGRMFGIHLVAGQLEACKVWPRAVVDAGYDQPVTSDVPALILSGDIDPVTPSTWGDAVAHHLRRGRHLVAAATGHGVAATGCGQRLIANFIDAGSADGLDTSCLADMRRPPFFLTPSGPNVSSPVQQR